MPLIALTVAVVVIAMIAIYRFSSITESKRIGELELSFYRDREPLSDAAYSDQLTDQSEIELHLAARRVMAHLCSTTPEMIYPTDSMRTLLDLQFDRGFIQDFVFGLESETERTIPLRSIPDPESRTFARFVDDLLQA